MKIVNSIKELKSYLAEEKRNNIPNLPVCVHIILFTKEIHTHKKSPPHQASFFFICYRIYFSATDASISLLCHVCLPGILCGY